jgi:hypothetical protein
MSWATTSHLKSIGLDAIEQPLRMEAPSKWFPVEII